MEQSTTTTQLEASKHLSTNNPYRRRISNRSEPEEKQLSSDRYHPEAADSEKQVVNDPSQLADVEKQVVEPISGPSNAPMVVGAESNPKYTALPIREADKEVTSSWQSNSKEDGAPIPVASEDPQSGQDNLLNDIKGQPPSYDSVNRQSTRESDDLITTPTSLEPDGAESALPPRPEDRSAVGQLLSWMPSVSSKPPAQTSPLFQPVVVPQLDVPPIGESVPFSRCYSDALAAHGVSMQEFTAFLDGLALAQSPNSALQGLKMFGAGMGHVPIPFIPLAGRGIKALATSSSGHSGSRAKLYLERAKREYFEPRGLRLSIVKDADLNPRIDVPSHVARLAPLTSSTLTVTTRDRRLEGIAPYIAPLRFDVPEQDKQIQGVHKMARKHLDSRLKEDSRDLKRWREDQWRGISSVGGTTVDWDGRYASKMAEIRGAQIDLTQAQSRSNEKAAETKELIDAIRQNQRELQHILSERHMATQRVQNGSRGVEAEIQEDKRSRKLKWIVIENSQRQ